MAMRHSSSASSRLARSTGVALVLSMLALVIACENDDGATSPPPGTGPTLDAGSSGFVESDASSAEDTSTIADGSPDGSNPGLTPSAECVAFGDAYCDLFSRCFPILLGGLAYDLSTCRARAGLGCALAEASPNGSKAPATCSAAIKAAQCGANITNLDPSCRVKGTVPNDGACEYDGQCASGACVKPANGAPCGVCKPRAGDKGACGAGVAQCDYGLQCAEGTCITPVALDGNCTKGACLPPNRCVANVGLPGATCKAPKATNAACGAAGAYDDACDAVRGEYCKGGVVAAGQCTPIQFANPTEACGVVNGNLVACKGAASCKNNKCVANAPDGAACNTTSGPDCTGPAECINGTCTIPKPDRCK